MTEFLLLDTVAWPLHKDGVTLDIAAWPLHKNDIQATRFKYKLILSCVRSELIVPASSCTPAVAVLCPMKQGSDPLETHC